MNIQEKLAQACARAQKSEEEQKAWLKVFPFLSPEAGEALLAIFLQEAEALEALQEETLKKMEEVEG